MSSFGPNILESLKTLITLVRHFSSVNSIMCCKSGFCTKFFATLLTFKGLFSCMTSHVLNQVMFVYESFLTHIAWKLPFTMYFSMMLIQDGLSNKSFATFITHEWFFSCVHSNVTIILAVLGQEPLPTSFIWTVNRMRLQMYNKVTSQRIRIIKFFSAMRAKMLCFSMFKESMRFSHMGY